jgi:hypothetical protein
MPTTDLRAPLNLLTTSPCRSTLPKPAASPAPLLTNAAAVPAQNWPRSGPLSRRQHLPLLCEVALFTSLCRLLPPRPTPSTPPSLRSKNQPSGAPSLPPYPAVGRHAAGGQNSTEVGTREIWLGKHGKVNDGNTFASEPTLYSYSGATAHKPAAACAVSASERRLRFKLIAYSNSGVE